MPRAAGIDLGTTNSVIAAWEGGEADVIPNAEGARTTPSVVAFTDSGERLVGQLARRQAILNAKGTIYSVKRFIGRRYEEVEEEAEQVTYDVVPDEHGNARITVKNLKVVRVDKDNNLLLIRGAVPGPNGGYLMVRQTNKV